MQIRLPDVPDLAWTGQPGEGRWDGSTLTLTAEAGVDWINDSWSGRRQHNATALVFSELDGPFSLSARVRVDDPRTTFDAAVLCVWADHDYWAKLCFEFSPAGQPMVVSVVTNVWSDDGNSVVVDGSSVYLRVSRFDPAWAFHCSRDGQVWEFVRTFRLATDAPLKVGFLAQSPTAGARQIAFDKIRLVRGALSNLRDGS